MALTTLKLSQMISAESVAFTHCANFRMASLCSFHSFHCNRTQIKISPTHIRVMTFITFFRRASLRYESSTIIFLSLHLIHSLERSSDETGELHNTRENARIMITTLMNHALFYRVNEDGRMPLAI